MTGFKMRKKPREPKRGVNWKEIYLGFEDTIGNTVDFFNKLVVAYGRDAEIHTDYDGDLYIRVKELEDEEKYENRLLNYRERLAEYEQWELENKEAIKEYYEAKKQEKKKKVLKELHIVEEQAEKLRKKLELIE